MIRITATGKEPTRATPGSAGVDIYALEGGVIMPGDSMVLSTGIYLDMSSNIAAKVQSRSGLGFKNGIVAFHGLIDSDYRDEVKVKLFNHGKSFYQIKKGERIAQLYFIEVLHPEVEIVSNNRDGGFGSTGR